MSNIVWDMISYRQSVDANTRTIEVEVPNRGTIHLNFIRMGVSNGEVAWTCTLTDDQIDSILDYKITATDKH